MDLYSLKTLTSYIVLFTARNFDITKAEEMLRAVSKLDYPGIDSLNHASSTFSRQCKQSQGLPVNESNK